jgi:hypothetical protein
VGKKLDASQGTFVEKDGCELTGDTLLPNHQAYFAVNFLKNSKRICIIFLRSKMDIQDNLVRQSD